MIIRDYLICLLQMYLLEDLEKNILPYRRERFWEKFLVYCIAALAMFGTNRLESSILNMVMIPVIYMIASMVVFRGNIWKKLVTVCCYYVLAIIPEFLFAALTNAYGVTGASEGFRTETEKTLALLLMSTMTFLFIKCINQVTRKRDYLTIENKTFTVLLIDLARHMGFSKPSISHAVGVLKNGGFLTVDEDGYLNLTNAGREVAEKIYERHQFFTEQLVAVGVDRETAERDACRIEHVISEEAFEKLKTSVEKSISTMLIHRIFYVHHTIELLRNVKQGMKLVY